jgi:carbonic anhydrase
MAIKRIIRGLSEFQNNYFARNQELFESLSHSQSPEILFITCCDSRISPALLTQTQPGELFIIRNLGNIIPPHSNASSSEGAAIEYAVKSLKVEHIVVCGHSDCGSMKAMLKLQQLSSELPLVNDWLKYHAESTRLLLSENYPEYSGEELLRLAIEENVLSQVENLTTYPAVRSKLRAQKISIYAWVYEIETGKIFAFNAIEGKFVPLEEKGFPVPNLMAQGRLCDLVDRPS